MHYTIPKGTFDILPHDPDPEGGWRESHLWQYVEQIMRSLSEHYGFLEIRTPLFEAAELFIRGVGEGSDIVSKEMYLFQDKAGRELALRPEGTACVMRAFIEKHLDQQAGIKKFFYINPMFRYERPQAGRYRQHHQFGVEVIGDGSPECDGEVIALLVEIYKQLGLQNLSVNLNSVGDAQTRTAFHKALKEFLSPQKEQLSADSQIRLEKNPLRILDSKDPTDQQLLQNAPSILDFLSPKAKEHFQRTIGLLQKAEIAFEVTPKLVRGLDYYNGVVFEVTSGELGAQNSVGGGGRYDGLLSTLGGPDLPSIGFGTGLERVIQTMLKQKAPLPSKKSPLLFLIPVGEKAKEAVFTLLLNLRRQFYVEVDWSSKRIGHSLSLADTMGAIYALVLGEEELGSGQIKVKNMKTRQEIPLALEQLPIFLGRNPLS